MNKIRFNGTEYNSAEEMPSAVRAAYDRALELAAQSGSGGVEPRVSVKFTTKVRFAHGGKTYDNPDEMPADVRALYDKAMRQIDKNDEGVPDMLQGASTAPEQFPTAERSSLEGLAPSQPVIAPEGTGSRAVLIGAAVALLALLIIAAGIFSAVFQH